MEPVAAFDPTTQTPVALGHRIINGFLIGCIAGVVCYWEMKVQARGAGDFSSALHQADALIRGLNPYLFTSFGHDNVPYPLTATLFALPFLSLPPELAAAAFVAASSALLAFAITRQGNRYLLLFLSYPFWAAVMAVQWSPLLTAGALLPWLFPAVIAKPNIGIAIASVRGTPWKFLICSLVVGLSLLIVPQWPILWLRQTFGYQSFVPLFSKVGALLLVALFWRHGEDSQTLLAMSLAPQRWYYDALPLWLIPCTCSELLGTSLLSWAAVFLTPSARSIQDVEVISVICNYVPMLLIVVARRRAGSLLCLTHNVYGAGQPV